MKVIIDIPENEFNHIKEVWSKRRGSIPYTNVAFGTPIPDSATNGEVIMIMFPEAEVSEIRGHFDKDELLGYRVWLGGRSQDYLLEWWNAPYQDKPSE